MQKLESTKMTNFFVVLLIGILTSQSKTAVATTANSKDTTQCEFYNVTLCSSTDENGRKNQCDEPEICESSDTKRNNCYVLWTTDANGNPLVQLKGCFLSSDSCYNPQNCIAGSKTIKENTDYYYCCCEGNMCNNNFTYIPGPSTPPPIQATPPEPKQSLIVIVLISIATGLLLVAFCFGFSYWLYRKNKHMFNELPTLDPHPIPPPSPYLAHLPIQLLEMKARGRFGEVWKAQFKTEEVAVKKFFVQDKQSWMTEQEIFRLPRMDHPNILHYVGVQKHGDNLQAEYWLLTAYHDRGSLCDFLKANTLNWFQLCRVVETMARGLMHLHEEIPGRVPGDLSKPAIAHRDFKSKNVLLKHDMTACIADFGLALVFVSGSSCGDTHGQVGTRRYMAPEVLEGAINFTPDAFLRIDMYACGLVLWEVVSRCTAVAQPTPTLLPPPATVVNQQPPQEQLQLLGGDSVVVDMLIGSSGVEEYRLPFEAEVGVHPLLEDMQEAVVQRKVRPKIADRWRLHPGISALCDTMEECWDHDAEARLSASCVMERVLLQSRYVYATTINGLQHHITDNDSPTKDNTISM